MISNANEITEKREKFSCYEFQIFKNTKAHGFSYVIYGDDYHKFWEGTDVLRESNEWFLTAQQARFAAIGHINLLENGKG